MLDSVGKITLLGETDTRITLKWNKVAGAEDYEVRYKFIRLLPVPDDSSGDDTSGDDTSGDSLEGRTSSNSLADATYSSENVRITERATIVTANITKLRQGAEYKFQVRAKTSDVDGPWSEQNYSTLLPPPKPGQIDTLTFPLRTVSSIDLTWDAPTNATDTTIYELRYKVRAALDYNVYPNINVIDTERSVTGLIRGLEYTFQVRAKNGGTIGEWSEEQHHSTYPVPIPRVGTLTFGTTNTNQINLSWDAVTGATGYDVLYKISSAAPTTYSSTNVTVTGTSATVTGLTAGTTYTFLVIGRDGNAIGEHWSSPQSHSTLPGPVGTLTFGTTNTNQINLSWNAVTGATGYDVEYKTGQGSYTDANVTVAGTTATVTDLVANTRYTFRARGINAGGNGSWSQEQSHSTSLEPVGTLTFDTTTNTSINLRWAAVTGATSYDVEYKTGQGSYTDANVTVAGTTATVTRLTAGTQYTFRVRAKNGSIIGPWSQEQSHSTSLEPVGTLRFGSTTDTQMVISWTPVQGATSHELQYKTGSGNWISKISTITARMLLGLPPSTEYTFRARGINAGGNGPWSQEQTHSTLLPRVGTITFGTTTATSINLSWTLVAGATGYDVEYKRNGSYSNANVTVTGTSAAVTGLTAGTRYTFRTRAKNANLLGSWSTEQTHSTSPSSPPPRPINPVSLLQVGTLTFGTKTDTEINLSWDAITGASGYDVEYKTWNGSYASANLTVTGTSARVTGLTASTRYTFRVRAKNGSVTGSWSREQSSLTFSPPNTPPVFSSFLVRSVSTISLYWNPIAGATGYEVQYKTGNGSYTDANATIRSATVHVTGLTPGTLYTFRARAKVGNTPGTWSEERVYSTVLAKVNNVTFGTTTTTSITLSWDAVPAATSYNVIYRAGSGDWSRANITITGTSATVTELTPGTQYTFLIEGKNAHARGQFSDEQTHSTLTTN